ncbi:MAG: ATP-binding cassette domain-containing protein [Actinobacteria bacterium]|nr:ATP-binding cassette domain-containing protein [Actinomycetota bacterium]
MSSVVFETKGLLKNFRVDSLKVPVLRGIDIQIEQGEFVAVVGPSGCGKSTLLHVLGMMCKHDGGDFRAWGQNVSELNQRQRTKMRREKIAFVFQRFNLLGVLSAKNNVQMALKIRGDHTDHQVNQALEEVGLAEKMHFKPSQLSVGEQQRVAIARALVCRPEVLLADEPTGSLDSENSKAVMELIRGLHDERAEQTTILITHNRRIVDAADRVLEMIDGKIKT